MSTPKERGSVLASPMVGTVAGVLAGGLITFAITWLQGHAQADQDRESFLRVERKTAYAAMIHADHTVRADELQSLEIVGQGLLSPREIAEFWDRQHASRTKLDEALAEVLIIGSTDALSAAEDLVEAHFEVTGALGDAGEASNSEDRVSQLAEHDAARDRLRAASDEFLEIVRENLDAE